MIYYSVFIIVERRLKTKWVIVIVPLIPYFSCLGKIPGSCSRPHPNISHYKAESVCDGTTVQPQPLLAGVWQRPFVSFMVSSGWGLIICTRLCLTQIHSKLFSSWVFDLEETVVCREGAWRSRVHPADVCILYMVHVWYCSVYCLFL